MSASIYATTIDYLTAEILTQKMPVSDAFNRAQAGSNRHGIHHGLTLEYYNANWPMKVFQTRYLKIRAGKAMIAATQVSEKANVDPVIIAVEALQDLNIDLEALSTPILDADPATYYVVLKVDYTASSVNNFTGLVANAGKNDPSIVFDVVTGNEGWTGKYGLVLGKISRANMYVESLNNSIMTPADIQSNINYETPEAMKDSTALMTEFRRRINLLGWSNLKKRVCISGLRNNNINSTLVLSDIAPSEATPISSWTRPVDWYNESPTGVYVTKGVWKDVEQFELFNSYFSSAVNLSFQRTPGHGRIQKVYSIDPADLMDESVVNAIVDYGSDHFVFDAKGTVFESDLNLDLVLDFTGYPHDRVFHVMIRNCTVKGNMTVRYGQSWLCLAGGSQGTIELENCVIYGTSRVEAWPQVSGVTLNAVLTVPTGYPASFNCAEYYLNNAGNVLFTNYKLGGVINSGPDILNKWRRNTVMYSAGYTKGVLVPVYLHSKTGGGGATFAMGDPWLKEGVEGGVRFKNCTIANKALLGQSLYDCDGASVFSPGLTEQIRVKLMGCAYWKDKTGLSDWNIAAQPSLRKVTDGVLTLAEYYLEEYRNVRAYDVEVDNDIIVEGDIVAGPSHVLKMIPSSGMYSGITDANIIYKQGFTPDAAITVREARRKIIHVTGSDASAGIKIATLGLTYQEQIGVHAYVTDSTGALVGYHLLGMITALPSPFSGLAFTPSSVGSTPAHANGGWWPAAGLLGKYALFVAAGDLYFIQPVAQAFHLVVEITHINYAY